MDLQKLTATTAVQAMKAGTLSSVELFDAQVDAMERFNPTVNAVVASAVESARSAARNADHRRHNGENLGSLAGLPLTIKDTYETVGMPTSSGSATRAQHMADEDADAVKAMRANGAIIYGKTNVPLFGGDHQTYNDVYGFTNNPWNLQRTAGGSSGGAAAAILTGMSLAEFGSDIGGSIRQPAHMNGVFGLKPTWGVVSLRGHIPGPPDLAVAGPLGRSVDDLELMLRTVLTVGAFNGIPGAELPSSDGTPTAESLRIGLWDDEPMARVSAVCRDAVTEIASAMEAAGSTIEPDIRPSIGPDLLFSTFLSLLWPVIGAGLPDPVWHELERAARSAPADDLRSIAPKLMTASHRAWLRANSVRGKIKAAWAEVFRHVDVMVMPIAPTQAFPHNTERQYIDRVVDVDGEMRPYTDSLFWAGLASAPGLPSVAIPTGNVDGLPVGVQLVGPLYSDFRLLDVARTVCEVTGSKFVPLPAGT